MNLDFILFSGPKASYKFTDVWGEVIFIPSYMPKQIPKPGLFSLTNCYTSTKAPEVYFSIDNALSDNQGLFAQEKLTITTEQSQIEEEIHHYIPTLYLNSMVESKYLLIYFHSAGEDIKQAHGLLNYMRNSYQANVIAMEYPGYGIYAGSSDGQRVNQDARVLYDFCIRELGFMEENIIVIGRSIGTGVALELLKKGKDSKTRQPRSLVLISPFSNVKELAKQYIGSLGKILVKEKYDNLDNISTVHCPVFILHGKKDTVISIQHSHDLISNFSPYVRKLL